MSLVDQLPAVLGDLAVGERVKGATTHRALNLRPPQPREPPPTPTPTVGQVCRRDRLGGLIHEYNRTAA
jgi:hypothetical protein